MRRERAELAPTRCPLCEAGIEGTWSRRLMAAGGRWYEQEGDHYWVRCRNGHTGDGESLEAAIEQLAKNAGRS